LRDSVEEALFIALVAQDKSCPDSAEVDKITKSLKIRGA